MAELVIKLANAELAGKTMQSINKEASAAATALKKAEVGTKAWVDAHERLEKAKGLQADLKKQIDSTSAASETLKGQVMGILGHIPGFQQMTGAVGGLKGGVGGLTSGFGLLRGAIIATGLGALVVLIASLFSWFTKTERGADLLAKATAALGAVWNVLVDRASKLIDALIALSKGEFREAAVKFAEAHQNVAEEIVKETKAAWDLADAMDALEERQNDFILTEAKARREASELAKIYEDQSQSVGRRTAAVKRAQEVEKQVASERLAMQREQIRLALQLEELSDAELQRLIEQGVKLEEVGMSESLEDDRKKAIEAVAEYVTLQGEFADRETELIKKMNAIRKKERAEDTKDLKAKEQAEKDYMTAKQNIEDMMLQQIMNNQMREIEALKLHTQRKIEALVGTEQQVRQQTELLKVQEMEGIAAIEEKYRQEKLAKDNKAREDGFRARKDQLDLELATDQNRLNQQLLNDQLTKDQWQMQSEQRLLEHKKREMDILRAHHGEESQEYQKALGDYVEMQQAASDKTEEILKEENEKRMQAMAGAAGVFANFFGALAEMQGKGTKQAKAFMVAQAIMSTIQSSIAAFQSTTQIPLVGPALAPIAAAAAFAFGMSNVRKIQNQRVEAPLSGTSEVKPVKRRWGGMLRGPRHSQGGIPLYEAEGGEFVFSREATAAIGESELSRVNSFYTRRMGGPIDPFVTTGASGGSTARSAGGGSPLSNDAIIAKLDELIESQNRRIDRLKVYNVATETEEQILRVKNIRNEADV